MPPVQLYVSILELAAFWSLLALAYYVMLECSGVFNFAVGGYALVCPMLMWWLIDHGWPMYIALAIGLLVTVVLSILSDYLVARPIDRRREHGSDELATVMAFVALMFVDATFRLGRPHFRSFTVSVAK